MKIKMDTYDENILKLQKNPILRLHRFTLSITSIYLNFYFLFFTFYFELSCPQLDSNQHYDLRRVVSYPVERWGRS